jgi:hypothetical protein
MSGTAIASIARVEVGGRSYPVVTESRCRVCCSVQRQRIEEEAVSGRPWHAIAADLDPGVEISPRNVRDHVSNGHVPIKEATVQALVDRQAHQRGEVVEQAVTVTVDFIDFCRTVVGTVNKQVLTGETRPTVRDAITASALLAQYEPAPEPAREVYERAFGAYHETVADVLTVDQFSVLSQRFADHPVLQQLSEEWEATNGRV